MNSKSISRTRPNRPLPQTLTLYIRGLGHIPSKKNSKMIILVNVKDGKGNKVLDSEGHPKKRAMIITNPAYQDVIKKIQESFRLQLQSYIRIISGEMPSTQSKHFWTAFVPLDDNWKVIPKLTIIGKKVPKGEEGAEIVITRLK